jgi:hypothetical protein
MSRRPFVNPFNPDKVYPDMPEKLEVQDIFTEEMEELGRINSFAYQPMEGVLCPPTQYCGISFYKTMLSTEVPQVMIVPATEINTILEFLKTRDVVRIYMTKHFLRADITNWSWDNTSYQNFRIGSARNTLNVDMVRVFGPPVFTEELPKEPDDGEKG